MQTAPATRLNPSSSTQMDVEHAIALPPPPPGRQAAETDSGTSPPQSPQGQAPNAEYYPPPGRRSYGGENFGPEEQRGNLRIQRHNDPHDPNMVYVPIVSEMGINARRQCYPDDDDTSNNMPRYLRVDRRYVGDLDDPPPPSHMARRRARRCSRGIGRFDYRHRVPFWRWRSSIQSRSPAAFRRRTDRRREPTEGRGEATEARDELNEGRDDRRIGPTERHGEPTEGRGNEPNEGGDEQLGTLVYDNVVIGDASRVRIGEGNRGGRRTGGRVSGNLVVR